VTCRHASVTVCFVVGPEFPEVLRFAANGDGAAFGRLWRDMHPMLLRYLRLSAGDAAEDLASEVWLEVARRIARFRGSELEFRSWLFTVARRRVIDLQRYKTRHPERPTADTERLDRPAPDDTAAKVLEGISTEAALAFIATLPREQAEMIILRVVAGLDVAQVARIVGKSPGAVRVATHRGLRSLSARLDGDATVTVRATSRPRRIRTSASGQEAVTLCLLPTVFWLRCCTSPASAGLALPDNRSMTRSPSDCGRASTRVPMPPPPSRPWR
jgi:RNA polymerase sigma-70 factor, ECF subfamily